MINRCMTLLCDELRADGIPDPLIADHTFAPLRDDLARLAGDAPPAADRCLCEDDRRPREPTGRERALPGTAVLTSPVSASS